MKTLKRISVVFGLALAFVLTSCELENTNEPTGESSILPDRFKVDIPNSLSNNGTSAMKSATSDSDTLNGNDIYRHLNFFILVGEEAAEVAQEIMRAIAFHGIDEPMTLSYQSDEDGRIKNLVVEENVEADGVVWEFMLLITDAESEDAADGGKGLQVFWNNDPIEGIAILKPYNIDRERNRLTNRAMFRIAYSEVATDRYDGYMTVEVAGMPMEEEGGAQHHGDRPSFALRNMKMFVGKKGDRVDVYGNSDHPNAKFFNDRAGFSWSFVASGYHSEDIGVAEVGLPPSTLDTDSREVILEEYSIKNVFTAEITEWFYDNIGIGPDSTDLANYLKNADAPGFFASQGFVQAGIAPSGSYTPLVEAINKLSPFNPNSIHELIIDFE